MNPIVVGIAGGTASGKTTTARAIDDALGDRCLWLTHDRYYRSIPAEYADNPVEYNFDHPAALETSRLVEDLRLLRAGRVARIPHYDFDSHTRKPELEWETVLPRELIVVEGILLLGDPALRDCLDWMVYVHAPADIRLVRRIRRDVAHRGRGVGAVLDQYERTVRPMHLRYVEPTRNYADLVVDGTTTTEAMVGAVLALVGLTPRREAL